MASQAEKLKGSEANGETNKVEDAQEDREDLSRLGELEHLDGGQKSVALDEVRLDLGRVLEDIYLRKNSALHAPQQDKTHQLERGFPQ